MKITNRLKIALKSMLELRLGKVMTDKAELVFDGEELEIGTEVFTHKPSDAEDVAPAEDGEYTAEDGRIIVVSEGKVAEIKEKEEETPAEEPATEVIEEAKVEEPVETKMEEETPVEDTPAPADAPEVTEEPVEETDEVAELKAKMAEMTEALNGIVNSLAAIEGRLQEVEGKLAKVEAPAAEPVDETPVAETKMSKMSYLRK